MSNPDLTGLLNQIQFRPNDRRQLRELRVSPADVFIVGQKRFILYSGVRSECLGVKASRLIDIGDSRKGSGNKGMRSLWYYKYSVERERLLNSEVREKTEDVKIDMRY